MRILLLLIFPLILFAAVSTNIQAQGLLSIFDAAKNTWIAAVVPFALRLFWLLVIIDWAWTFGMLLLKGTEISEILSTLIQKVLIIGFFLTMFQYTTWLDTIPQSFGQLADNLNALPQRITPDTILEQGFSIVDTVWGSTSWFSNPGDSIGLMIAGLVILFAFIIMTAMFFTVMVKLYLLIVGAYFILALGGLSYTRSMGVNSIIAVFKAGLELFFIKLLLGFSLNTITTMAANVGTDNSSIMAMIGISILIAALVSMISGLVDSLTHGTLGTNGSLASNTKGAMMGAGAGAVGGAMASMTQVQNANHSSGGSNSENNNNSDSGNFMSKSKQTAQVAGAGIAGASIGGVSGAIKGAMGFSTYSSGNKSGTKVGKLFSSNKGNHSTNSSTTTSNRDSSKNDMLSGTIGSQAANDSQNNEEENSYISGIPRSDTNE
jgi:type IV secretion system protein TrbL